MTTVDRLRADIDSGATGDKVAGSDPAAAPLGTDEEAAGTPLSQKAIKMARSYETEGPAKKEGKGGALSYMTILAAVIMVLTGGMLYAIGVR